MAKNIGQSPLHTVSLFVVLAGVWLLWSGHYTGLVTSLGGISCLLVVVLARRMRVVDEEGQPIRWGIRPFFYIPWLLWEVVKANIDVALRVVGVKPAEPTLAEVAVPQQTDLGKVIYANSITLTPGTISIVLDDNKVLVHAISGGGIDDLNSGTMARKVSWLEGQV